MVVVAENGVDTHKRVSYGPAPAGFFLTSKIIDEVPGLSTSPVGQRVREILTASESDLFSPLMTSAAPNDFQLSFTLFANKYFPVRLQALILILNQVENADKFWTDYFNRAPKIATSLAMHAGQWGLHVDEVVTSFGQYFETALKIVKVSRFIHHAPVPDLLRLVGAITELDYGFTAMGLVFEGSIKSPEPWRISEVFRLTRRSLLDYEAATESVLVHLNQIKPGQGQMFTEPKAPAKHVVSIRPRALRQAGKHLRSIGSKVKWPEDDVDSDFE